MTCRESVKLCLWVAVTLLVSGILVPAASFAPRTGKPASVLVPPWISTEVAVLRVWDAGGYVVSTTRHGVLAIGQDPDFYRNLRKGGLVLILDGEKLAALCGAGLETGRNSSDA